MKSLGGRVRKEHILTLGFLLILLCLIYLIEEGYLFDSYFSRIIKLSVTYAIAAISMNLINGMTGQFSLGQAGFMAVGAYITGLLIIPPDSKQLQFFITPIAPWVRDLHAPFIVAIIIGGIFAAFFAFLIGFPVLRLKSDYLAIATLGFSEIIRVTAVNAPSITNSSLGLKNIPPIANLWWCIGTLAVIAYLVLKLMKTTHGRSFKAIRDDETAAEAIGINLFKQKLTSFIISGFIAGISGGLLASVVGVITPPYFKFTLANEILLIVVLGGMGSITGSIVAATALTAGREFLRILDDGFSLGPLTVKGVPGMRMLVFSVLLMVVVLFFNEGFFGAKEFSWKGLGSIFKKLKIPRKELKK